MRYTGLSGEQRAVLAAVHDRTVEKGAKQAYLGHLQSHPYYLDGRTVAGMTRRGYLERHAPEPPFALPSYTLTEKGLAEVARG